MAAAESPSPPSHIVILPSPSVGHLVPFAALASRLVLSRGFKVTLLIPPGATTSLPAAKIRPFLASLPPGITATQLPDCPDSNPKHDSNLTAEARMILSVVRCLPSLHALLSSSVAVKPKALVVGMFGVDTIHFAKKVGVPEYVFFPMSTMPWLLTQHLLRVDPSTMDVTADPAVRLPGCVPLLPKDVPEVLRNRGGEVSGWFLNHLKRCEKADGVLFNSFEAMEPGAVKYLLGEREADPGCPRAFPIGPLMHSVPSHTPHPCLEWLDGQPLGSVLFVCLGSGGTLSAKQLEELAVGLEGSQQRFLWVVRPSISAPDASFFEDRACEDPSEYLPAGFLERTKEMGMVLPSWEPQSVVLGHAATGGFLTHYGWNSILEAVERAVPMIAWPLYAEQSLNVALIVKGAKIALRRVVRGREEREREREQWTGGTIRVDGGKMKCVHNVVPLVIGGGGITNH